MTEFKKEVIEVGFTKSKDFRTIAATGAWGGPNRQGEIVCSFYVERQQFPDDLVVELGPVAKETEGKTIDSARIKQLVKSHRIKKLNIILKADTKGSLEAIVQILETIKSEEAAIQILKMGVGNITETDINMANSSGAKIIGFNIDLDVSVKKFARKEDVDIKVYKIIYELMNDIKEELSSILGTEVVRTDLGVLKVIAIFKSGKKSAKKTDMIIGAKVESGKIEKASLIEVLRDGEKVGQGKVKELQYNKKIAEEVKSGNNAGITYEGDVIIEEGDVLNVYKEEERKREI